jgi:hypothetical protein
LSQNSGVVPKYRARRSAVSAVTARGRFSRMIEPIRVAGTRSASASALADSPSGCMNSSRSTSPGCVRMRPGRVPLSVVIDDLDILGAFQAKQIRH